MTHHELNIDALTVLYIDDHGEAYDLNAHGEPCADEADLAEFVRELHKQGAFDREAMQDLLEEIPAER